METTANLARTEALPARAEILPADRHPALVYLAKLSPGSRRAMRGALDTVAAILTGGRMDHCSLPWGGLRYQHTAAVRAALAERYAPATANRVLSALRGVLREAWRLGYMTAEEQARATDLHNVRGSRPPAGRSLSSGELRALFLSCAEDPSPARGARDAALLAVLYGAGLRRAEAVALDLRDYTPETGVLRVHGKGGKARLCHLRNGSRDALAWWVEVRGGMPGPLFAPVNKGGRVSLRSLTGTAVRDALLRRAERARVPAFTPHDLRRSFVGDLLDAGADLSTVSAMAGHAQVQTTARYDRRGERTKARAAELLPVPFVRGA